MDFGPSWHLATALQLQSGKFYIKIGTFLTFYIEIQKNFVYSEATESHFFFSVKF